MYMYNAHACTCTIHMHVHCTCPTTELGSPTLNAYSITVHQEVLPIANNGTQHITQLKYFWCVYVNIEIFGKVIRVHPMNNVHNLLDCT